MKEEYWKIIALREYLASLKEEKIKCNVTRSEVADNLLKINLMNEAENYGRKEERQKIIGIIKKFPVDEYTDYEIGVTLKKDLIKEVIKNGDL